ncbi:MAG: protease complex subunit PrcB family protein [Bacillota bacterium]
MRYRTILIAGLILLLGFSAGCRSAAGESASPETEIDFSIPDALPDAVQNWVDEISDSREAAVDWMTDGDEVYVAVARGEVPHPGHGVAIDRIVCRDEDGEVTVTVEARYTEPEEGMQYIQVISYPVAVGVFDADELPGSDPGDVRFEFSVDDRVAEVTPTAHNIVLFFATEDGWLERDVRSIVTDELTLDIVASEIAIGPEVGYLHPVLPEGTNLRVTRDEDDPTLAIVDFSEEIHGVQGSLDEMIALYGVVNALIENDLDVSRVMVLVGGQQVSSLGHVDLTEPLTYDRSLVRESK